MGAQLDKIQIHFSFFIPHIPPRPTFPHHSSLSAELALVKTFPPPFKAPVGDHYYSSPISLECLYFFGINLLKGGFQDDF